MTTLLISMATLVPSVFAYPEPVASHGTIQAIVALPELSPREELAVRAVAENLLEGTEEYSKFQLRRWGGQIGERPRVEMMPGFIRIGFSFPNGQAATAVSMVDSLLRRAQLSKESLDMWQAKPPVDASDYWARALWTSTPTSRDLRQTDVQDAYRRFFRPENIWLGIGGTISDADTERLKTRLSDWVPPRLTRPAADFNRQVPVLGNNTAISTFEIRSPAVAGSDPRFPATVLSTFALGVGKDSSLFRVVREQLRISYRQEAILWPSPTGFEVRLLIARSDPSFNPELGSTVKAELEADVELWTEATRERAIGMARGSFQYRTGPNPMYLSVRAPLSSSLEDQTFFRLFWQYKSGTAWNAQTFVSRLETVSTADLKSAAKDMLKRSNVTAIIGMRGRTAN